MKRFDICVALAFAAVTAATWPFIANAATACLASGVWDMRNVSLTNSYLDVLSLYDKCLTGFVLYVIGRCAYQHGFKNRQNKKSEV